QVAGSIRREQPVVRDLELVVVPRRGPAWWETDHLLYQAVMMKDALRRVTWIKPGVPDVVPWAIKPDGKYWRGHLRDGTKLDLFIAAPTNYGLILLIRTG